MEDNQFIHQDTQKITTVINAEVTPKEKELKHLLMKRTVGTSLITAFITLLLTASILFYVFYSFLIPAFNSKQTNSLSFSSDAKTMTAITKLKQVISEIRKNYLEELTDSQIIDAMTVGLPSGLDNPYTYYMSAKEYNANTEAMSGKYAGIGCTVTFVEKTGVEVVEVVTDGPAQKSGILPKDLLISVDGVDVHAVKDANEIAVKVKGVEGTTVKLEIYRPSTKAKMTFSIVRKTIISKNILYRMLDKTTGYVHVKAFAEGVDTDFIKAMDDLQKQGAVNVVFDFRYNSGGNAQVMIDMLDYLLPKGTLLASIKGRENNKPFNIDWITQKGMKVPEKMKYAILTNEYTASASEFFSGCLRDYKKATLIGKNTFGKGSGTKLYELADGSAVNITMFKYYLPNGESIEGKGLKPDIELDLALEFRSLNIESLTPLQDIQLAKAIEILK